MAANQNAIRFILDGRPISASGVAPTTTLLEHLREQCGATGVKEGCAEGDCGACTVAVGELEADALRWRAVNACIRFLPTLDGKEVLTAQGLAGADGSLHPVQQAMVDYHASQCGFCTTGFVMSLFGLYQDCSQTAPQRAEVVNAISGNLCRCTGYRPIIDAGLNMHRYTAPASGNAADPAAPARVQALRALQRPDGLELDGYYAPRRVDDFAAWYEAHPDALILAGGTDIGLWVTKQLRALPPMLYIGEVAELQTIAASDDGVEIGAAVRLEQAFAALVARYPHLDELMRRFASRPIRNSGTLCGNIANGSPIGDAMPALIALGAQVRLRRGAQTRTLALEDVYLGYQKKALAPGEFVASVWVPSPRPDTRYAAYKISKRYDQDISAVCAGIAVSLRDGQVTHARLAFGGLAATPKRAIHAERTLIGQPWTQASVDAAAQALAQDFQPITDMRSSAAYRAAVARNLLRRFWLEDHAAVTRVEHLAPIGLAADA